MDTHTPEAGQPATPPAPALPPAPQPNPKKTENAKASKIFTLKTAAILSVIVLLIGFLAGWAAAPNAPKTEGGDTAKEIASLRRTMEANGNSATEVAELRSKLTRAEEAHRTAEFALGDAKMKLKEVEAAKKAAEDAQKVAEEFLGTLKVVNPIPEGFILEDGKTELYAR